MRPQETEKELILSAPHSHLVIRHPRKFIQRIHTYSQDYTKNIVLCDSPAKMWISEELLVEVGYLGPQRFDE